MLPASGRLAQTQTWAEGPNPLLLLLGITSFQLCKRQTGGIWSWAAFSRRRWMMPLSSCSGTWTLSPPPASGSNKFVPPDKDCTPKVLKDDSRVFCRSLLPFSSLMSIVPAITAAWKRWVFLAVSNFSVMYEGAFKLCPQLFILIIQDGSPSFSSLGRIKKLSCYRPYM